MSNIDNALERLEWEDISFPLTLSNININHGLYNKCEDLHIRIDRNNEFNLISELEGKLSTELNLDDPDVTAPLMNSFLNEPIVCKEGKNEFYKLRNCLIQLMSFSRCNDDPKKYCFKAKLLISSIVKYNNTDDKIWSIIDWHLTAKSRLTLPRITRRINKYPYKLRDGIDVEFNSTKKSSESLVSLNRDFLRLTLGKLVIIVQKVDSEYLPDWAGGLMIEYRSDQRCLPVPLTRAAIAEFVGFIFGSELIGIGTTSYNEILLPISSTHAKPTGNNPIKSCEAGFSPPINETRWFNDPKLEEGLSLLMFNYLKVRDKYDFEDLVWKLNLGRMQILGTNLPILASGFEVLVDNYLKENEVIKKWSKGQKKDYQDLIENDLKSLENKLKDFQFCNSLLNRIKYPNDYSINEKIKLFFEHVGMDIDEDSVESKAVKARNIMAHNSMTDLPETQVISLIRFGNAYITLINRVILLLIKYNGKYLDYYSNQIVLRDLTENILPDDLNLP